MWTGTVRVVESVSALCAFVARWTAVALSMVMIASLLLQVFFRYVLENALTWSDEVALLSFVWVVLLLASVGVRDGFHVRLSLFLNLLPAPARNVMERILLLGVGAFGVFLAISGYRYVEATRGQISAAIGYPTELLHAAGVVCGVLIVVQALARAVLGPTQDKDPELAEEERG